MIFACPICAGSLQEGDYVSEERIPISVLSAPLAKQGAYKRRSWHIEVECENGHRFDARRELPSQASNHAWTGGYSSVVSRGA